MTNSRESPRACPVCELELPERKGRCYRCETPLGAWWPLLAAIERVDARAESGRPSRAGRAWWAAGATVVSLMFALGWLSRGMTSLEAQRERGAGQKAVVIEARPCPPVAGTGSTTQSPRATVAYRVQRGDTLGRISVALFGSPDAWRNVWPQWIGREGSLPIGWTLKYEASESDTGRR